MQITSRQDRPRQNSRRSGKSFGTIAPINVLSVTASLRQTPYDAFESRVQDSGRRLNKKTVGATPTASETIRQPHHVVIAWRVERHIGVHSHEA